MGPGYATALGLEARAFPGLRDFAEDAAAMFFSRDDELRKLRDRLEIANATNRLIAVVDPSGSGKSSLLRGAGLLAALGYDPRWHVAPATVIEPRSPLEALAVALEHVAARLEPGPGWRRPCGSSSPAALAIAAFAPPHVDAPERHHVSRRLPQQRRLTVDEPATLATSRG